MGGYGSTRWNYHNKKTAVEDCIKLTIYALKPYLHPGQIGHSTWTRGGRETGSMNWLVTGRDEPEAIRFIYTTTDRRSGEKTDYDYSIPLTYTVTPWGARRYWFICKLGIMRPCGRRVGALFIPPGGNYFGCRHCYKLTYTSAQEARKWEGLYKRMAGWMQEEFPGITSADLRYMWDRNEHGKHPKGGYFEREYQAALQSLHDGMENYDPYPGYLTIDELRAKSGLTADNLALLETARLLLPDHNGRYRPKLASWGRKLAYLLGDGWTIDELSAWARGRWATSNPRQFPPDRAEWSDIFQHR